MKLGSALLLSLAACGSSSETVDANVLRPVDARDMSDASRVEITVYGHAGDGVRSTTAKVFFADPDGTWAMETTVDANGVAVGYLPEGGSVTVFDRNAGPYTLTTIRGVKPGDKLIAGRTIRRIERGGAELPMQPSIVLPQGATHADLYGACLGGNHVSAFLFSACVTPTFGALAIAEHSEGDQYLFQADNTYAFNGPLTLTGTFHPVRTEEVWVSGLPMDVATLTLKSYATFDNAPIEVGSVELLPSPGGVFGRAMRFTPIEGRTSMLLGYVYGGGVPTPRLLHVAVRASPAVPAALDLAAQPLPQLSQLSTTERTVSWIESGTGTPDARFVQWDVQWFNDVDQLVSARWEVMEPPSEDPSSDMPSLPPAYILEDPSAAGTDVQYRRATAAYVDYDNLEGYEAARPYGFQLREIERVMLDVEHRAHRSSL